MEAGYKGIYDGHFQGNILVVGKTGCRKMYFLQKLALSKFFGNLVKTEWVSGIELDNQREDEIQSCFSYKVEFYEAKETDDLSDLIEKITLRTREIVNNESNSGLCEKISMDRLIIMKRPFR